MRKVYLIWLVRRLAQSATVKGAIVAVLFWQMSAHVSFASVYTNWQEAAHGLNANYAFFESALANTELTTYLLSLLVVMVGIWFVRDVATRRLFSRSPLAVRM